MPINTTNVYDQAGVNEYGFMMSTTNSTSFKGATVLPASARNISRGGFAESLMNTVILGEAKDSDNALEVWGKIVETDGMSEGCFWMMNDNGGNIWITENMGGWRWVAARVPDDSICVIANDCVIDYVDLNDTKNFRGSKDLLTFPKTWADTNPGSADFSIYGPAGSPNAGKLNVAATYGSQNGTGNAYRRWMGFHMFAPSQNIQLRTAPSATKFVLDPNEYPYPTFIKPDRKVSALDVMKFQRSRFEGTPYDVSAHNITFGTAALNRRLGRYIHMLAEGGEPQIPGTTIGARPIGTPSQKETHVYEYIPEFPPAIGARWWFQEGQPEHSVNLPFYGNINDTHPAYKKLTVAHAYDPESAFWVFRDLSYMARSNRVQYGRPIRAYWDTYEAKLFNDQAAITKELLERHNKDPKDAANWITDYTLTTTQNAMNRAGLIRKALQKHMGTNSGDLFVVPSDSIPFVSATFDIHATSGDALVSITDIKDVAEAYGLDERWSVNAAWLKLPSPYPLQHFTPILYTVQDLTTGHPATFGEKTTVLPMPGVRVYANLQSNDHSAGNLIKVRYTAEIMGDAYKIFENSADKVKKGFSLHAMLPGFTGGFELVGPNGLVTMSEVIKTGKGWVMGDTERATVVIDFYLYDEAGVPAYGNGGKIVVPDGKADFTLDTGALWAAAYKIEEEKEKDDDDKCKGSSGCQAFPIVSLLGIAMMVGVLFRRKY
jgi:dipeptidase